MRDDLGRCNFSRSTSPYLSSKFSEERGTLRKERERGRGTRSPRYSIWEYRGNFIVQYLVSIHGGRARWGKFGGDVSSTRVRVCIYVYVHADKNI